MKGGYQLYVKWRFITSPDVEETQSGKPVAKGSPEEVGEDVYHPDKLISVGPGFESAAAASAYARLRGWKREDCDIRPCGGASVSSIERK